MIAFSTPVSIRAYSTTNPHCRRNAIRGSALWGSRPGEHVPAIERRNRNQVEERQQQIDDDERHTDLCGEPTASGACEHATGARLRQRPPAAGC